MSYSGKLEGNGIIVFTKGDDASEGAPDLKFYEQGEGAWKDREIGAMWEQSPGFYTGKLLDERAAAMLVTNKAKPNMPDLKLYREIGALWKDKPREQGGWADANGDPAGFDPEDDIQF